MVHSRFRALCVFVWVESWWGEKEEQMADETSENRLPFNETK